MASHELARIIISKLEILVIREIDATKSHISKINIKPILLNRILSAVLLVHIATKKMERYLLIILHEGLRLLLLVHIWVVRYRLHLAIWSSICAPGLTSRQACGDVARGTTAPRLIMLELVYGWNDDAVLISACSIFFVIFFKLLILSII